MCVVIYLCLTSDSFPPCGRNSHVTARNTAGDPRDLSCNIRTHHVSSEPENISWLSTSYFLEWLFIRQRLSCFIRNSKPAYPNLCFYEVRWTVRSRVDSRTFIFFPFYTIETKDYENPRNANKFRPNETIPNECSEEEALMHKCPSGEHLASSIVSRVQFLVF